MKRSELTVGMIVAVKRGYGDGEKATVTSLDKHKTDTRGRISTGTGTGLLVMVGENTISGPRQVVVQPQAVLGEWDAYQARLEAERKAREEGYRAQQVERASRDQAEADALALAKEHAIPAHPYFHSHSSPQVVLPVEVFAALVAALPQGFTYTAQEG